MKLHVFYRKEITKQEKAFIVFVINFNSFKTNEGQKCHSSPFFSIFFKTSFQTFINLVKSLLTLNHLFSQSFSKLPSRHFINLVKSILTLNHLYSQSFLKLPSRHFINLVKSLLTLNQIFKL